MAKNIEDMLTEVLFRRAGTCTLTNERVAVVISRKQFDRWKIGGDFIQDVCPELNNSEREFLMSGLTSAEFDDMFVEDRHD